MKFVTRWWQRLSVYRRLRALEERPALDTRVQELETEMWRGGASGLGIEGIVSRLGRCERCGGVYLGGSGLVKLSSNVDGEVRAVVVCGTCWHLLKSTHRA